LPDGLRASQKQMFRELQAFAHPDDEPNTVTVAEQLAIFKPLRARNAVYLADLQRGAPARPEPPVDPLVSAACAELLAYLRALVQEPGAQWSQWVRLDEFAFTSLRVGGRVEIDVDGATPDIIKLKLMLLVQQVGLANVRICARDGCPRLFAKTYRREFCSKRCQMRAYMLQWRRQERERQARQVRDRQRRKAKGVSR
jgi:hypothetical protein